MSVYGSILLNTQIEHSQMRLLLLFAFSVRLFFGKSIFIFDFFLYSSFFLLNKILCFLLFSCILLLFDLFCFVVCLLADLF